MPASPTKQATVEDATSASPTPTTPPPTSELPESSSTQVDKVEDQPIDSSGDDDEEEDEWDPSSERLPGQSSSTSKEKGKAVEDENDKEEEGKEKEQGQEQPWQAVWAAEQNAWYFWNKDTGEVTWTNPLEPSTSSTQPPLPAEQPPTASSSTNPGPNDDDNGYGFGFGGDPSQPEIDPGLAHLFGGDSSGPGGLGGDPTMQKAMFNSRTGRFTASNYEYTVGHLDEYNRAKRMNSHYFDVDQWEREKQQENEKKRKALEDGKGGEKKITKKDMERFRKKNAEKKARSQAWLRE